MGTKMGRIEQEFILSNIIEKKLPVKLQSGKIIVTGIFLSMVEDSLLFSSSDSLIGAIHEEEYVTIFFAFFSHTMTFNTRVIKDGNPLTITIPKHIYKNLFMPVHPSILAASYNSFGIFCNPAKNNII